MDSIVDGDKYYRKKTKPGEVVKDVLGMTYSFD